MRVLRFLLKGTELRMTYTGSECDSSLTVGHFSVTVWRDSTPLWSATALFEALTLLGSNETTSGGGAMLHAKEAYMKCCDAIRSCGEKATADNLVLGSPEVVAARDAYRAAEIIGTRKVLTKAEVLRAGKQFNGLDLGVSDKVAKAMRTKAISDWTEQQGLLGRVVTVTGIGSYTVATSWNVQEVVCRMQDRGHCQGCGRDVAVVGGFVADHGFRIQWNSREGVCLGSGRPPAEVSVEYTKTRIEGLLRRADEIQLELEVSNAILARPWELTKEQRNSVYQRDELRHFAKHLREGVLPLIGKSLRQVPVADLGSAS